MELRDLIVTPIVIMIVYALAFMVRPMVTDPVTRGYYFPALTAKIIGAIALGFIYQFYYNGGDTFAFHTHGSREIWQAFFKESPELGMRLLFASGKHEPDFYYYEEAIWYFRDQHSYFIIRLATLFDFLTFSSYSGTAVLFAVLSFCGGWMLFLTFYKIQPAMHRWFAISALFIPSVVFWGSGILKDTVTFAFLGIATYCFYVFLIERKIKIGSVILFLFSLYVIFSIKKYILVSFMGALMVWLFFSYFLRIKSTMLRLILVPFVLAGCILASYAAVNRVVQDDPQYSLDRLAETAKVTAYDIRYWTGKDAGSGYTLGELDGTLTGMLKLAPAAVNVSLFRPYLWEIRNPLMVMAAIESFFILLLTLYVLFNVRSKIFTYIQTPEVAFCLVFALIFAFGVGVSTYNFGSLSRYKIPLMPYYVIALGMILNKWRIDKTARYRFDEAIDEY